MRECHQLEIMIQTISAEGDGVSTAGDYIRMMTILLVIIPWILLHYQEKQVWKNVNIGGRQNNE